MQLVCQQQALDGPQDSQTCPSGLQDMLDLATEVLVVMATSRHTTGKNPRADSVFISTTTSCGHHEPVINTLSISPFRFPPPAGVTCGMDGQNALRSSVLKMPLCQKPRQAGLCSARTGPERRVTLSVGQSPLRSPEVPPGGTKGDNTEETCPFGLEPVY